MSPDHPSRPLRATGRSRHAGGRDRASRCSRSPSVGRRRPPAAAVVPPVVGPRTAGHVTADPLPTVQINGVVWDQEIVGNTVYVVGDFTQARPAGAAPGTNETPRANVLAYNLTTGALHPRLRGQPNNQAKTVDAVARRLAHLHRRAVHAR